MDQDKADAHARGQTVWVKPRRNGDGTETKGYWRRPPSSPVSERAWHTLVRAGKGSQVPLAAINKTLKQAEEATAPISTWHHELMASNKALQAKVNALEAENAELREAAKAGIEVKLDTNTDLQQRLDAATASVKWLEMQLTTLRRSHDVDVRNKDAEIKARDHAISALQKAIAMTGGK